VKALMSQIVEAVRRRARDTPDAALIDAPAERRLVTAGGLAADAAAIAGSLRELGIGKGHVVAAHVGNRCGFFPLLLACLDAGAALLPIDGSSPRSEASTVATRFAASALVEPLDRHDGGHVLAGGLRLERRSDPPAPLAPTAHGPVAMLKLTSGSTGVPKATLTTEDQLAADGRALIEVMGITPHLWQIGVIPVSHSYALGNIVAPLLLQGTPVVLRDAFVPTQVLDDAVRVDARIFSGVPFMFERLAGILRDGCPWPARLDTLISAGAPLDRAVARAIAERTGRRIHSLYGTSETGGIAYDARPDPLGEVTMGQPVPGVTLAFWPDDAATAGTGRIHVTGPAVSSGYAGGVEDGGFTGGGFLTGDLGVLGDDGRLRLKGRVSTFVNVAGRKVLPDEVDRVLRTHPLVADVRVFGMPDERRGEQLAACVVPRPPDDGGAGLGVVALRAFCADRLAAYKIPRALVLVPELPRDERGKVNRRALEALVTTAPRGGP
jgi:acyl-CoA synthetase (AMP-forming)/AMP-acid ligase II